MFERYGFEPLQTPPFERLETLTGKYGDEGDKLIFKILRRGEHEATGEADLALRYDMTVPLARVVAGYGSQLPTPYKRYAMGPVWRLTVQAEGPVPRVRPMRCGRGRLASPLADAEVVCALTDALDAVGVRDYRVLVNSRQALSGLLEVYGVPADLGGGVLITLDKLDKLPAAQVAAELVDVRSLASDIAEALVGDLTATDAVERMQTALKDSEAGRAGLEEIGRLLELASPKVGKDRIAFTPSLVRGLDYYTGVIFEVVAEGMPGSIASGGRYDKLTSALGGPDVPACGGSLGVERIIGRPAQRRPRRRAQDRRRRHSDHRRHRVRSHGLRRAAAGRGPADRGVSGRQSQTGQAAEVGRRPQGPLRADLRDVRPRSGGDYGPRHGFG